MAQHPILKTLAEKSTYTFGKTYIFRLRQHIGDNFSGLWDLDILDEKGIERARVNEVIGQADNLNINLENLGGKIENDGY